VVYARGSIPYRFGKAIFVLLQQLDRSGAITLFEKLIG
jgi:hypothetical protein